MPIRLPRLLKEGDTIALLAPASPHPNADEIPACVAAAERFGLRVKEYPTLRKTVDYMAGTPKQRAADLSRAFADDRIQGVFCLRGGYAAIHTVPLLDWKAIGASRKLFTGFSDITSLLTPLYSKSRLASLHAPTMTHYLKSGATTEESFRGMKRFLFEDWSGISYRELCGDWFKPKKISRGRARGRIIGGNAAVFAAMVGTPWMPKTKDNILFLEDTHEKPYRLDRYVTQMIQAGLFKGVNGVVLGQFNDCEPGSEDRDDVITVLARVLKPLGIPVLAGLPVGHDRPSFPLPIGVEVELDVEKGDLRIV